MEWDKKYVKTQSYKNGIFLDNILSYIKECVNTYTDYEYLYIIGKRLQIHIRFFWAKPKGFLLECFQ